MAQNIFTLHDENTGARFPLKQAFFASSIASYAIHSVKDDEGTAHVTIDRHLNGHDETETSESDLNQDMLPPLALLSVCYPIVKLTISQSEIPIYVEPDHFDTESAAVVLDEVMRVNPTKNADVGELRYCVMLRLGDVIRVGEAKDKLRFRLEVYSESTKTILNESDIRANSMNKAKPDIQVGSSIPEIPDENDNGTSTIEVNQSIRIDDTNLESSEDTSQLENRLGKEGSLPLKKRPIVAETPAARQKTRDAVEHADQSADQSQMPQLLEDQLQLYNTSENTSKEIYEESQEIIGVADLQTKNTSRLNQTFQRDFDGSLDIPMSEQAEDYVDDHKQEFVQKQESVESGEIFVTAPQTESRSYDGPPDEQNPSVEDTGDEDDGDLETNDEDDLETEDEANDVVQEESFNYEDEKLMSEAHRLKVSSPKAPIPLATLTKPDRKRKSDSDAPEEPLVKKRKSMSTTPSKAIDKVRVVISPNTETTRKLRSSQPDSPNPLASSFTPINANADEAPKTPRIIFSNSTIPTKPSIMKFLAAQGAKEVDRATAKGFDMLVVGIGELKRTSKLLTAMLLCKRVVTDAWVIASSKAGKLLPTSAAEYAPKDKALEQEWDFSVPDAFMMQRDRKGLMTGKTIFVTPALKREYGAAGFADIKGIVMLAGAKEVVSKAARDALHGNYDDSEEDDSTVLFIGREKDDIDAQALVEHGRKCYSKDLISISVLRGTMELDDAKLMLPVVMAGTGVSGPGKGKAVGKGGRKTKAR